MTLIETLEKSLQGKEPKEWPVPVSKGDVEKILTILKCIKWYYDEGDCIFDIEVINLINIMTKD